MTWSASGAIYLFATYFFNLVNHSDQDYGVTGDFAGVSEFAFVAAALALVWATLCLVGDGRPEKNEPSR
jgi:hypothetical protein